jgi:hypothetical protein
VTRVRDDDAVPSGGPEKTAVMIIRVWREQGSLRATVATHDVISETDTQPEYFTSDEGVLDSVRRWLERA